MSAALEIRYTAPRRDRATAELHSRPFPQLSPPTRVFHLVLLAAPGDREAVRAAITSLIGAPGFADGEPHVHATVTLDGQPLDLRAEVHTEFVSLSLFAHAPAPAPLDQMLPPGFLVDLELEPIVACDVLCRPGGEEEWRPDPPLSALAVGSIVLDGTARVRTDFTVSGDGLTRFVIDFDRTVEPATAGRIVQQVLEIETYRTLAVLGLDPARDMGEELSRIAAALPLTDSAQDGPTEVAMFSTLVSLSGRLDRLWQTASYRFAASHAYYAVLKSRLAELGEQRLGEAQTLSQFLDRRLAPALATCAAVERRREALADQIATRLSLIRTRIDLAEQKQSRALLASIDRGAERQLQVQKAVEGLSVVAISYYAMGLIGYLLDGIGPVLSVEPKLIKAALFVPVAVFVYLGLRRLRRHL